MASAGSVRAGGAFVEIFAKDGPFQVAMARVQARLKAVGAAMQQFGTKMMLGGTAIGLPLVLAARSAATFEDAILGLKAAAGLSAEDISKLEAQAIALSRSMGVAPAKVANAMLELAKAGMSVEDILGGAAESAVQFARVSGVDMAEAAVFMKVAMNSFGVSAVEAVDTLSAAADASETSIAAMVESFALVGSAGALFNQSLFDISQGLAVLARFGIRGEEAGTGIKTMLVRLTSPSKEAEDALAKIGLTLGDFRDADGKLLPLVQIVGVLEKALVGVDQQMRDKILGDVFGDRGIRVIGAFLQVGTRGFETMADAMESNLPVSKKFEILMSGITGAFEKLGAAVQRLSISFAKAIGDSAGKVVNGLVWIIDVLGMLIEMFPFASKVIAGATAAIFLLGAAAIVGGVACKVLAAGIGFVTAALAVLATPVGLIATILVGGITLILVAARQLSPEFRKQFDAIFAAIAALDFKRAWQLLVLDLAIALVGAQKKVHDFFAWIGNAATAAGGFMADMLLEGLDRFMSLFGSDIITLQTAFQKLGLYFRAAFDWKFAVTGLRAALAEADAEAERMRERSPTAGARSAERKKARKDAADERQRQDEERRASYDSTIEALIEERDGLILRRKKGADKTSAKRSEKRKPGFVPPSSGAAAGGSGFGAVLSTFASDIAGQITFGPQLDVAKETADNTKRTADGVQALLNANAVDFGKGGMPNVNDLQQALAGIKDQTAPNAAADDKDLVSAAEQTAAASERQVSILSQIHNAIRNGGLAFA